ncbi:hypothetical protein [Actinoplanes philippinensis]|uniref:hypothetical protein n=1 Tax=Actinoplanes philippinensis TaxID=35752 RepID=UPI0033E996EA
MAGDLNRGRLYCRCTAGRDYVRRHQISHPPPLPSQGPEITTPIDRFLRQELTGTALTDDIQRVAEAQFRDALAAHDTAGDVEKLRQAIADTKINCYRATLDAGGDTALIATGSVKPRRSRKPYRRASVSPRRRPNG